MIRFFSVRTAFSTGLALAAFSIALPAQTVTKGSSTPVQSPYQGTVVEDIVARVNDGIISRSDYDHALDDLNATAKQHNWTEAEVEAQKKDLLRDLIDNQLLLSKGKELDITGENETVRQLDELRKQNHLDTMEDLQKAAEQQGVSFEDFKASIRNRVITSQVIREEVGRRINISQADEQAYYEAHKSDFDRPEEVKLSEILIPTANPDDAAQVADAEKKANDLEAQLKAGKDFAAVAKAGSGGPTAAQGGEIGDFKRGQLAKVLEDQTFSLEPGKYTEPIRTKQGYVILKVDEHQAGGVAPFKDVEGEIQDRVGMTKMNPALRSYMRRLREEAYIDIKPGYVDSAASPNETKPIFSAYAPPTPKKKKKLERTRFGGRGRTRMANTQTAKAAAPNGAAVPAGVPSLAEVPQGDANTATVTPAKGTTPASAAVPATSSSSKNKQVASLKPGKKEKIRYGQAPRETLPTGAERSEDAGATAANGNASEGEKAQAAEQAAPNNGAAPTTQVASNVPAGTRYTNGESATDEAAPEKPTVKTRFSDRPIVKKDKAAKAKKVDPFAPAPAAPDEVATQATQDRPLGLAGDTSKKAPKVKATGPKVRYADVPHDKPAGTPAEPASTPESTPTAAPQAAPANPAPSETQKTPSGTGDPLGPATPGTPSSTPNGAPPQ
jgi:peptidyl-prolyl cis-trans isomerase SurA